MQYNKARLASEAIFHQRFEQLGKPKMMPRLIHFLLNDSEARLSQPPSITVLDYLRETARLTGAKMGCGEGGCGACMVLVGQQQDDQMVYEAVLSCLLPLGELQGKHLLTIEGLNQATLSPVQQALIEQGATQCGFCTPGIVMALTAYLMSADAERRQIGIRQALGGNLCRCTGYAAILRAARQLLETTPGAPHLVDWIAQQLLPAYCRTAPERLSQLARPPTPEPAGSPGVKIAGGTDLYAQQGETLTSAGVRFLSQTPDLKGIALQAGQIHVGALTTLAELAVDPLMQAWFPELPIYMERIASWPIRHRATVGGNLVTASPIGDISCLFLALEATLVLRQGSRSRTAPIKAFFREYRQTILQPGELLAKIVLPLPTAQTKTHFEKISKRGHLDCAVVNSAIRVTYEGGVIHDLGLSMGGVAPTPLFLQQTCDYYLEKPLIPERLWGAFPILQAEIAPISDVYGSARYKRLLARQLMIAHFTHLFPEVMSVKDVYAAH